MSRWTAGKVNGKSLYSKDSVMPVEAIRWRGKTVIRSELATTLPAVKNWLTVSKMRRSRWICDSASSIKPCARPEKLTNKWFAAQ